MTREHQLETICAVCVKANSGIYVRHGNLCDPYEYGVYATHRMCDTRPIRLADVLLALESKHREDYAIVSNGFFLTWRSDNRFGQDGDWKGANTEARWNFRKDDLSEQSDECIAFLAELLK